MPRRYSNTRKVKLDGHTFDSIRESKRYMDLKLLERAGEISELEVHPRIPITIGGIEIRYGSGRHMTYVADFRYWENGVQIVEDLKMSSGFLTEVYKIKRALVLAMGIRISEVW